MTLSDLDKIIDLESNYEGRMKIALPMSQTRLIMIWHRIYITKKVDTRKYVYFHSGFFKPLKPPKKLRSNSIYNKNQVNGRIPMYWFFNMGPLLI